MKFLPTIALATSLGCLLPACLQLPIDEADCQHEDCAQTTHASIPVQPTADDAGAWARSKEEPSVLYARDGTPVLRDTAPTIEPPGLPGPRDVDRPETGRLYLLELYQQAVDERDDLMDEVMRQETFLLELRASNSGFEAQVAELRAKVLELEGDKQRAEQQNYDLASRVTTAQIGRLQAELRQLRNEKLMLDTGSRAPNADGMGGDQASAESGRSSQ